MVVTVNVVDTQLSRIVEEYIFARSLYALLLQWPPVE